MGYMKEFDIRIRNGGDDAIAAVAELWEAREKILFDMTDAFTRARWIPVEERLPEDGQWCWVDWDAPGKPFPAQRDSDAAGGWTNLDTWEDFAKKVTRWMPLPEPPVSPDAVREQWDQLHKGPREMPEVK